MRPYRCGTRFGSTWIVHNDRSSKARVVVDKGQLKSGLLEPSIWVPLTSSLYACTSTNAGSPCTLASSIFMWARARGERLRVMSVCMCVCVCCPNVVSDMQRHVPCHWDHSSRSPCARCALHMLRSALRNGNGRDRDRCAAPRVYAIAKGN